MKTVFALLLLMLCSLPLFSQTTIIDSVYANTLMDGNIDSRPDGTVAGVVTSLTYIDVGDLDNEEYNLCATRAYFSFPMNQLPAGYQIEQVILRLYQIASCGISIDSTIISTFPYWDVAGGDTIKCIVSHIDYGPSLDSEDWAKGDLGNPYTYKHNVGTITAAGMSVAVNYSETGYRTLDVTDCVLQDYVLGRDYSQYRVAFEIDTDNDTYPDLVSFCSANEISTYDYAVPKLFIKMVNPTSIDEGIEPATTSVTGRVQPNPFQDQFNCKVGLAKEEMLSIKIYDIKGRLVDVLTSGQRSKGTHQFVYHNATLTPGVYVVRISTKTETIVKKITCLQ